MIRKIISWFVKKHLKVTSPNNLFIANTVKCKKDSRDYEDTLVTTSIPDEYVIPNLPSIRNQKTIGSCASHAAVRVAETYLKQKGRYLEGSEMFHYYVARKEIAKTYPKLTGMTIKDACKTLQKYGMGLEKLSPYKVSSANEKPNQLAYVLAAFYKVRYYYRLHNLEQIKNSILNDTPVIFGLMIDDNFMSLNKWKKIWTPGGRSRGGHALTIVGYNNITNRFLVDNSWGYNWGKLGQFEISYDDFKKKSFDWFKIEMR